MAPLDHENKKRRQTPSTAPIQSRSEQPTAAVSSCRTPGMAGRKALVLFRISLPYNFKPAPQRIQLYGSWSSYTTSITMERDARAGHGIWKSCGPRGGLEQGAMYGYYYVMDGKTIWYDPGAGRTVRDDKTGKIVNVVEVPMEMPSVEEDVSSPKASATSVNIPTMRIDQGKEHGGGRRERSYEQEYQHRAAAWKTEPSVASSAPLPPPHHYHHEYTDSPKSGHIPRRSEPEYSHLTPSRNAVPIPQQHSRASANSVRQMVYSSSSSGFTEPQRIPYRPAKSQTQIDPNLPPKFSGRRKPVPSSVPLPQDIPSPAPIQPNQTRLSQGAQKPRKKSSFGFLNRRVSRSSLPPSPVPGPPPPGGFHSPYPPPPPPPRHATFTYQEQPSPSESVNIVSPKKRWSFLSSGLQNPSGVPNPPGPNPSPSPAINSPKRKSGRFFSLSRGFGIGNSSTPRPDISSRSTSLTMNPSHSAVNTSTVDSGFRGRRIPSPLDIPPPPDFVMENLRSRNLARSMTDQSVDTRKSRRGLWGGESRTGRESSGWYGSLSKSRGGTDSRGGDWRAFLQGRGTQGTESRNTMASRSESRGDGTPTFRRLVLPRNYSMVASSTHTMSSRGGATIRTYSGFGAEVSRSGGGDGGFVMVGSSAESDSGSNDDDDDEVDRKFNIGRNRKDSYASSNSGSDTETEMNDEKVLTPVVNPPAAAPPPSSLESRNSHISEQLFPRLKHNDNKYSTTRPLPIPVHNNSRRGVLLVDNLQVERTSRTISASSSSSSLRTATAAVVQTPSITSSYAVALTDDSNSNAVLERNTSPSPPSSSSASSGRTPTRNTIEDPPASSSSSITPGSLQQSTSLSSTAGAFSSRYFPATTIQQQHPTTSFSSSDNHRLAGSGGTNTTTTEDRVLESSHSTSVGGGVPVKMSRVSTRISATVAGGGGNRNTIVSSPTTSYIGDISEVLEGVATATLKIHNDNPLPLSEMMVRTVSDFDTDNEEGGMFIMMDDDDDIDTSTEADLQNVDLVHHHHLDHPHSRACSPKTTAAPSLSQLTAAVEASSNNGGMNMSIKGGGGIGMHGIELEMNGLSCLRDLRESAQRVLYIRWDIGEVLGWWGGAVG